MGARVLISSILILAAISVGRNAMAGACCGGGSSVAGIMLGDEKRLLGIDLENRVVVTDVSSGGVWRDRTQSENQQTLKLHLSSLISDRLQLGVSPAIIKKARSGDSETSLGDTSISFAYEAIPDWDYNPFRPKGTLYMELSVPTGRSVYESQTLGFLDAGGKGYASIGIGLILNKTISKLSVVISSEVHHGFYKSQIRPGWGYSASGSLSYNLQSWITGLSVQSGITHSYQGTFHLEQEGRLETILPLQVSSASVGLSYSTTEDDPTVFHLSYADQALLGTPLNTPLGKTVSIGIRKQILR